MLLSYLSNGGTLMFTRIGTGIVFLLAASTSWATITFNCATTAAGNPLNTYGAPAAGNGCATADLSFENLNAVAGVAGTGSATDATTATVDIYGVSALGTGATVGPAGSVNMFLDPSAAATWASLTSGSDSSHETISGFTTAHSTNAGGTTYTLPANAGLHWIFTGFTLTPTGTNISATNTLTITRTFCVGATSTTVNTGGCTAANEGTLIATDTGNGTTSSFTYTCTGGAGVSCQSATSNVVTFAAALNVAFSDAIVLSRTSGTGQDVTLTNWETVFSESAVAPEPSTFVLSGAALTALLALRNRKRKA
jgi:hypothetical protein